MIRRDARLQRRITDLQSDVADWPGCRRSRTAGRQSRTAKMLILEQGGRTNAPSRPISTANSTTHDLRVDTSTAREPSHSTLTLERFIRRRASRTSRSFGRSRVFYEHLGFWRELWLARSVIDRQTRSSALPTVPAPGRRPRATMFGEEAARRSNASNH